MSENAPAQQPAGWYPDPHGRHDSRYFDGAHWSLNVRDATGGVSREVGPITAAAPAAPVEDTVAGPSGAVSARDVAVPAARLPVPAQPNYPVVKARSAPPTKGGGRSKVGAIVAAIVIALVAVGVWALTR